MWVIGHTGSPPDYPTCAAERKQRSDGLIPACHDETPTSAAPDLMVPEKRRRRGRRKRKNMVQGKRGGGKEGLRGHIRMKEEV